MCRASVVTDDWVVKGCHIHVDGVELAVRPDHLGGVTFKKVFASTPDDVADAAIRRARRDCLPDPAVRDRWRRDLGRAMEYVRTYHGELAELANGRQLEFRFLIVALDRYGA
jgi:hypothetical protein